MPHFTVAHCSGFDVAAGRKFRGGRPSRRSESRPLGAVGVARPVRQVRASPLAAVLREFEDTTGVALTHVRELAGGATLVALRVAVPLAEAKRIAASLAPSPAVESA